MDQDSVKLGLLMETAQTHQKLAEAAIEKLSEHTQTLEAVARDQIQRALVDALKTVHTEAQGAAEALRSMKREANARVTLWTLGLTVTSAAIALFIAWWVLPTPREIARLRIERDGLVSNIAVLNATRRACRLASLRGGARVRAGGPQCAAVRREFRLHGHQGLLGEQAKKFAVDDQRKLKPKGKAEHQEEGQTRWPEELPEQRRENAKQGARAQHEGDDWLEDEKKEEQWQPDALPESPQGASAKIGCDG